jgi:hypothetical protein
VVGKVGTEILVSKSFVAQWTYGEHTEGTRRRAGR